MSRAIDDAVEAQQRLRASAGLTARVFPIQALTEMLEEDIAVMRRAGRSDSLICEVILHATGRRILPMQLDAGAAPARKRAARRQRVLRLVQRA